MTRYRLAGRGYTPLGLALGAAALALIFVAASYALRRRAAQEWLPGTLRGWLWAHVALGALALLLALLHGGVWVRLSFGWAALALLAVVVVSGLVGRLIYSRLPPLAARMVQNLIVADTEREIERLDLLREQQLAGRSATFKAMVADLTARQAARQEWQAARTQSSGAEEQALAAIADLTLRQEQLRRQLVAQLRYKRLLRAWQIAHVPVSAALVLVLAVHIVVAMAGCWCTAATSARHALAEPKLDAEFIHVLRFADGQISGLAQLTDSERWAKAVQTDEGTSKSSAVEFNVEGGARHDSDGEMPDVRNAIDATMAEEIYEVAQLCANDPAIRAVLMLANGKSFTVGGDLAFLANTKPGDLPGLLRAMTGPYHEALRTFSRLSVPIVAGVQGAAAGGGLGMMYCADIVLAAENAKFATGFGALGLSMDGANSWFLPRLVGMRRAAELYFEERVLDANEALEWGLVTRVVPLAQLQEQALACATRLANGPTSAYGEVRRLYRESLSATLAEQLGAETEALCRTAGTADATDAIASFVGKRKPVFGGQ